MGRRNHSRDWTAKGLREWMEGNELNQLQAANALGVSRSQLRGWLHGRWPTLPCVWMAAGAYDAGLRLPGDEGPFDQLRRNILREAKAAYHSLELAGWAGQRPLPP